MVYSFKMQLFKNIKKLNNMHIGCYSRKWITHIPEKMQQV